MTGEDEALEKLIGEVLDSRYRIIEALGEGGVGMVYRAEHVKLRREVAVKVLHRETADVKQIRLRFEREAQAMAALVHPNIVKVTDFGIWKGRPFLVMELIEGPTLKEMILEGPLEPNLVMTVSRQLLDAVAFAHSEGLIHRDLKPSNILLRDQPEGPSIVILDFGFAKFLDRDIEQDGAQLTATGTVMGTPAYIAPEQAAGQRADERADLYAIGLILYEMIAGRKPFEGSTADLLRHQLFSKPPPLSELCPNLVKPAVVDAFIQRALAKRTSHRFQSAEEMKAALEPFLAAVGCNARRPTSIIEVLQTLVTDLVARVPFVPPRSRQTVTLALLVAAVGALNVMALGLPITVCSVLFLSSEAPNAQWHNGVPGSVSSSAQGDPSGSDEVMEFDLPSTLAGSIWDTPDEPAFITEAHTTLDAGQQLSDRQVRQLRTYSMNHRRDPRPLLLLARHRMTRGNFSDAISRYEGAFAADPLARNDPQMLIDLVALSKQRTVGQRAAQAVTRIFGVDALDQVAEALLDPALNEAEKWRLRRLHNDLVKLSR